MFKKRNLITRYHQQVKDFPHWI